jgi:hypothetical protein
VPQAVIEYVARQTEASPTYDPSISGPNLADTTLRLIIKLWPRRSWVDSITNTVWKDVLLDLPEE